MKLNLKSLELLRVLKKRVGLDESYMPNFNVERSWSNLSPEEWALFDVSGLEANLNDVKISQDKTLEWKGHKVILYIQTVRTDGWQSIDDQNLPRFHVANCSTLQSKRIDGSFARYVVSQRTTGKFILKIRNLDKEKELQVCRNCLETLNYQNFKSKPNIDKRQVVKSFTIVDFFKEYHLGFYDVPSFTEHTAVYDNYPKNWKEVSAEIRWSKHWKCDECRIDLVSHKRYLHVHHKNHIRSDCSPSNLAVLCIECHGKQDNHSHIKNLKDYSSFFTVKEQLLKKNRK
jgi:hypothetical protein